MFARGLRERAAERVRENQADYVEGFMFLHNAAEDDVTQRCWDDVSEGGTPAVMWKLD